MTPTTYLWYTKIYNRFFILMGSKLIPWNWIEIMLIWVEKTVNCLSPNKHGFFKYFKSNTVPKI